ncbi:DUF4232 domain-containing protein [Streptomyces fagopyri]|uniref:DUF4232 domain-containing protein n=1 Tax=Streptomyces fagopyri TaxID=2662397 RepID=UPI00367BB674
MEHRKDGSRLPRAVVLPGTEWSVAVVMNAYRNADETAARPLAGARGSRRITRAVLAGAAVAGLGIAGTAAAQAAPGSGAHSAKTTPTCSVSALKATFGKELAGGMNHQGVVINLRNLSGRTCALRGFPGLGLENSAHKTLTSHTYWGDTWYAPSPAKKTLALKDGESAEAVISWSHANTGTRDAVHAAYLQITPPAATQHKTLAFPRWVDNGQLKVTALARHIDVNE